MNPLNAIKSIWSKSPPTYRVSVTVVANGKMTNTYPYPNNHSVFTNRQLAESAAQTHYRATKNAMRVDVFESGVASPVFTIP